MFENKEETPEFEKNYRHAKIRQFKIGRFVFKDHILKILSEAENDEFLNIAKDLPIYDRQHISEVMNLENFRPLDLTRRVDGPGTTTNMRDARDRTGNDLGQNSDPVVKTQSSDSGESVSEPAPAETPAAPTPATRPAFVLGGKPG